MKMKLFNRRNRLLAFFCLLAFLLRVTAAVAGDIYPEDFANCNPSNGDDTACWQEAINAATSASLPYYFGTVAGASGKIYIIKNTLKICNTTGGMIDGHGAILRWEGPAGVPLFLVINANQLKIANLTIVSNSSAPLYSAFEFTSASVGDDPCVGTQTAIPSSKDSIDHVIVNGTNANGLMYGVRFSNRYNDNVNNDMSTIINSTFYNVMVAAVSVEHSQSQEHQLIDVNGYGAPGNTGCFVNATTGFISTTGGFEGNWGKADFCLDGAYGPFNIIGVNSEGSNRLLQVGNPGDVTGYPVTVNILGGRFAVNGLDSDGSLVSFNRLGPLTVRGLRVDGTPPSGVQPDISFQPGQMDSSTSASAIIDGVSFYIPGSSNWNTLIIKGFANLTAQGNLCDDGTSMVVCKSPYRN